MQYLAIKSQSPFLTILVVITICLIVISIFLTFKSRKDKLFISKYTQHLESKPPEEWIRIWEEQTQQIGKKIQNGQAAYADLDRAIDESERLAQQIEVGLLPPTFKQSDCENIKKHINRCREQQYQFIRNGNATVGLSNWDWFGSKTDGKRMVDGYRRLLLKAYNAEFEVILRQMRVSTYDKAVDKLYKLSETLGNLGATAGVEITSNYHSLKVDELTIWHSELIRLDDQKRELKEQQALLREQAKNTQLVDDDIEFQIEAKNAEIRHARETARNQTLQERARLDLQITKVEEEKAALLEKLTRSKSQAQITRAGFIYVISNVGCFGHNVVKIGMTRRLQPLDRIKELSDASVPFRFDLHTLAFTHDAPSLERALHWTFDKQRLNKQNLRREYFQVAPQDVQKVMEDMGIHSDWYFEVEAKEYRESLLIEQTIRQTAAESAGSSTLPAAI